MPDHQPSPTSPEPSVISHRIVAAIEVLLCSDLPTQVAIGGTLQALGYGPMSNGSLNIGYVVALSLGDAVLLIGLILVLLVAHGERPREVLFGRGRVMPEVVLGVPLIFLALAIGLTVILSLQRVAPSLRTVPENPLQDLLRSPRDAWLFALVLVVAGGLREEIQRAFLLHRFDVWLGGPIVGVIVTSVGVRRRPSAAGRRRRDRDRPARRVLGLHLFPAPVVRRADGQPRRVRSDSDRAVSRAALRPGLGSSVDGQTGRDRSRRRGGAGRRPIRP